MFQVGVLFMFAARVHIRIVRSDSDVQRAPIDTRPSRVASANPLDDPGNRTFRPAAAYAMRALFAQLAAVPKLAMRFPTTEYVASLAMVRFSNPASPCCVTSVIALCAGVGGP